MSNKVHDIKCNSCAHNINNACNLPISCVNGSMWKQKVTPVDCYIRPHRVFVVDDRDNPAYSALKRVLDLAYEQAAVGKGKERHVQYTDEPFQDQQICEIARRVGTGGPAYQAIKKIIESIGLPPERGLKELLGAINYIAGMYIVMEEQVETNDA